MRLLTEQSIAVRLEHPDSSLVLVDSALRIADRTSEPRLFVAALIARANTLEVLSYAGDSHLQDSARSLHKQALRIALEIPDNRLIATASSNLGTGYRNDNPFLSIDYHMLALDSWQNMRQSMKYDAFSDIANSYEQIGRIKEARALYHDAIQIADSIGDKYRQVIGRIDLANSYMSTGQCDSTIYWCKALLKLTRSAHSRSSIFLSMARCMTRQGEIVGARVAIDSVKFFRSKTELSANRCEELWAEANILALEGRHTDARGLLEEADLICNSEDVTLKNKATGQFIAAESYHVLGEHEKAYEKLIISIQLKDSLMTNKRDGLILDLQEKYQLGEKEANIKELKLRNDLNEAKIERKGQERRWLLGSGALLMLAGGVFIYTDRKRRRERFEKEAATLETQALRSQMNPHFIFNALNSINAFVQQNDPDNATSFLTKFARVMRGVLENSRHSEVSLEDDLETLRGYMELERMRMGGKFDFAIEVAEDIDPEEVMVPPLVVQPFVENAIWHGMKGREDKGHIALRVKKEGQQLVWQIEDDGAGRQAKTDTPPESTPIQPVKKTSLGTAITRSRLDLVQKQHGGKAGFRYEDLAKGTRVIVEMPLLLA